MTLYETEGGKLHRLVHILTWIFFIPFTGAVFLILGTSLFTTVYYDLYQEADLPRFGREHIFLLLILTAAVLGILSLISSRSEILQGNSNHIYVQGKMLPGSRALHLAMFWCGVFCLWLILMVRGLAVNDGLKLDMVINAFMKGDFSSLTQQGGYMFLCPHQIGYVAIGQFLYLLFGASNYMVFQLLNMAAILIVVWMLYQITWELFESRPVCNLMTVMSMGMLFLYVYSTLVYNDIWSLAPEFTALYLTLRYLKYHHISDAMWSCVLAGCAIVIKENAAISMAAILIMLLLDALRGLDQENRRAKRKLLLTNFLLMLFLIIMSKGITAGVDMAYAKAAGLTAMPKGEPSSGYVAMGMHEGDGEWGWYNGYNLSIYGDNGYDWNKANQAALTEIQNRLSAFASRPLHGARFYVRKFLTQWADPTCISMRNLELTSRHVEGQPALMHFVIYGTGRTLLSWVMNIYETLVYLGVAIYCIAVIRSGKLEFHQALPILFIFGGMVFHELWEASSRYTIRYYVCMLPYGAYGVSLVCRMFNRKDVSDKLNM